MSAALFYFNLPMQLPSMYIRPPYHAYLMKLGASLQSSLAFKTHLELDA